MWVVCWFRQSIDLELSKLACIPQRKFFGFLGAFGKDEERLGCKREAATRRTENLPMGFGAQG